MGLLASTLSHRKHFSVTGYVVNKNHSRLLMIHHRKLGKWLPPGGHLEDNELPHEGAIREAFEETGVMARCISSDEPNLSLQDMDDVQIPRPFAMAYQLIPKSDKDDEHIHLDMMYILEADETQIPRAQLAEVHAAKWFAKSEILSTQNVFDSAKSFAHLYLQ